MGSEQIRRRKLESSQQARILAQEAISIDPEYSAAYLLLARTYLDDIWYYNTKSAAKTFGAKEQVDPKVYRFNWSRCYHTSLARYCFLHKETVRDKADIEYQKAVDLSPNSADANYSFGRPDRYSGRFEEAIHFFLKKAIRLNPITPLNYKNNLAWAYAFSEQYEKAISIWNKLIELHSDYFFAYMGLALVHQLTGDELKAREAAAEVMRLKPKLTVSMLAKDQQREIVTENECWRHCAKRVSQSKITSYTIDISNKVGIISPVKNCRYHLCRFSYCW